MEELKPCPFCGCKAEITHYRDDGYLPHCTKCAGMVETWFKFEEEAVKAWNTRTPLE